MATTTRDLKNIRVAGPRRRFIEGVSKCKPALRPPEIAGKT
jgi:hypothetical protein